MTRPNEQKHKSKNAQLLKKAYLNLLTLSVIAFMLFGPKQNYLSKFYWFFLFLPMFVFLFVVVRHIFDNNRSQLLSREI